MSMEIKNDSEWHSVRMGITLLTVRVINAIFKIISLSV